MRNILKSIVVAAAATVASATATLAADMAVKARPVVPPVAYVYDWSGFYIGAFGGGVWGSSNTFTSASGVPVRVKAEGGFGGVHAGYDWQFPNRVVIGVNLAVPVVGADGRTPDPLFPAVASYEARLAWAALFTGYIGMAVGNEGRWLPYIGGGLVVGEGKATFNNPVGSFSDRQTHVGYTAIAGLRYGFTPNFWGSVQYNYVDVGSETYTFTPAAATRSIDFHSHSISGILSYRFGPLR